MTAGQLIVVIVVGLIFALVLLWLITDNRALWEAIDAARDETDRALGGVQAVHDHLAGAEPAGTGRHAAATPSRGAIATSRARTDELPVPRTTNATTLGGLSSHEKRGRG